MIGKAFKSLKGMINEAKEIVTEKVSSISSSNISNSITNNTFIINGRTYYENKLLGEGGYGYVFEVSDSKGNKYALKKINILNKSQYQNILHEVQIWKQISKCPNIIKLLTFLLKLLARDLTKLQDSSLVNSNINIVPSKSMENLGKSFLSLLKK